MFAAAINAVLRLFARAPQPAPKPTPTYSVPYGRSLLYLIGAQKPMGKPNCITMMPYGEPPAPIGLSAAYINLFRQDNEPPRYAPYLAKTDVGRRYREGRPDPEGQGFMRSFEEQASLARKQGHAFIETDNRDAYRNKYVLKTFDRAKDLGLMVFVKNPGLSDYDEDTLDLVKHPNAVGMICEQASEHTPRAMHALRVRAGKPNMPVWFVAFGEGHAWASKVASEAAGYPMMGVSYCFGDGDEEYADAVELQLPKQSF